MTFSNFQPFHWCFSSLSHLSFLLPFACFSIFYFQGFSCSSSLCMSVLSVKMPYMHLVSIQGCEEFRHNEQIQTSKVYELLLSI